MAIAFTTLTNGSGVSVTTQATASVTPDASAVTFVAAFINYALGSTAPTISGCGLTWTLISSVPVTAAANYILHVWSGVGTPSAGAITYTAQGTDTWSRTAWRVFDFTGANTTTPLIAANTVSASPAGSGNTTQTITYAQAFAANSAGVAFFVAQSNNEASETPRSGWTDIGFNASGGDIALAAHYRLTSDTAGGITWPSGAALAGLIVELAAAGGAPASWGPLLSDSLNRLIVTQ